ncbi:uncharacterized protein RSE6_01088 [Rhynchosporium secalis]|uniref:Uncharacterized protein n=1 Tax=Rhynchosporium secalis TaxID=38038 RepID=A0A1E1LWX6_RHYSE|nr:uncharacterized protein RSE6_01088 [Rhynchosporium secalis]
MPEPRITFMYMKDTGAAAAQISTCYEPQCYPISPVIKKDPAAYNEVLVAVREMLQARLLQTSICIP